MVVQSKRMGALLSGKCQSLKMLQRLQGENLMMKKSLAMQ